MYQITCDGYILHDSRSNNIRLVEPKCDMELNKTGTLSFRVQPTHPFFDSIKKHKSEISLYQDGEWIFTGRVLNDETDIYGYKTVQVEGMLGYLLDSIQRTNEHHLTGSNKIKRYLTDVLNIHNRHVDESKKFSVGTVTLDDSSEQLYKISSYKDTLTTINEDLIDTFGGYFFARRNNGINYLDYIKTDDFPINNQVIQLGKNILSFKKQAKGEEIATIILPLGERKSSTSSGDSAVELKEHVTISELPSSKDGSIIHAEGSDFVYDEEAIKEYGRITKVVEFGDIKEPENLLKKAKEQLKYYKTSNTSLELSVFDLHLLNVNIQSVRVGQKIRVVSTPHQVDDYMIVQKITLDIAQADKSTVTLITEERSAVAVNNGSISNKINATDNNINYTQMSQQTLNNKVQNYHDDLSLYAKISDVNSAFNELAVLLGGL